MNALEGVTPDFIGHCKQKVARPACTPCSVTAERLVTMKFAPTAAVNSRHSIESYRLTPWVFHPAENHMIKIKLLTTKIDSLED